MTMSKAKAAAKKMQFKKWQQKHIEPDSDGSLSSDDVDELENKYIGTILNEEYMLVRYINKGAFSRVWLGYYFPLKEYRVLKIYFPGEDDEFKDELKALKMIKSMNLKHNITYYEGMSSKLDGVKHNILVLPYMGMALRELIYDRNDVRKLRLYELKYLIKEICLGIKELHDNRIVHADIKLDNVLTTFYEDEDIKFTDWFTSLNIAEMREQILISTIPENYNEMNASKKKNVKRKCKLKCEKEMTSRVSKLVLDYIEKNELDELESEFENVCEDSNIEEIDDFVNEQKDNENKLELNENVDIDLEIDENNEFDLDTVVESSNGNNDKNDLLCNINTIKLKLADFSNSISFDDIDEEEEYPIRAYMSPENIIGYGFEPKSEVWIIGCLVIKLLTDEYIFEPELEGDKLNKDKGQLKLMEKYLGKMNKDISLDSPRSWELFEESGRIKGKHFRKVEDKTTIYEFLKEKRPDLSDIELNEICGFLKHILCYDVRQRYNINQCLADSFLSEQ